MSLIRRAFSGLISLINKTLGAVAGFFLTPIANVIWVILTHLAIDIVVALFFIAFTAVVGYATLQSYGFLAAIGATLLTLGGLTLVAGVGLFVQAFVFAWQGIVGFVTGPFQGFSLGLKSGLFPLLKSLFISPENSVNVPNLSDLHNSLNQVVNPNPENNHSSSAQLIFQSVANAAQIAVFHPIDNAAKPLPSDGRELHPISADRFEALRLSASEYQQLVTDRTLYQPLTDQEIQRLESDRQCADQIKDYKSLKRLENGDCLLSGERPAQQDTILLEKQYKDGHVWKPVPGLAYIFDKNWLKDAFVGTPRSHGNAVHPVTYDLITEPSYYKVGDQEYSGENVRYVIYNYYDHQGRGISQEAIALTSVLRERLYNPPQSSSYIADQAALDDFFQPNSRLSRILNQFDSW